MRNFIAGLAALVLAACGGQKTIEFGGDMAAESSEQGDTGAPASDEGGEETGSAADSGTAGSDSGTTSETGESPAEETGSVAESGQLEETGASPDEGGEDTAGDSGEPASDGGSETDTAGGEDTIDCGTYVPNCDGTVVLWCQEGEVRSYDCADAGRTCGTSDGVAQCVDLEEADTADSGVLYDDPDADGDGYGESEDCDDSDPDVNPGATETCNGIDDDCDGLTDDEETGLVDGSSFYWLDADGDGYGAGEGGVACDVPAGYVTKSGDCDDDDATVNPDATEIADDGIDQDCDGEDEVSPEAVICEGGDACITDLDGDGNESDLCLAADRFTRGEEYEEAPAYVVGDNLFDYSLESSDLVYPADGYFCLDFDELVSRTGSADITLVSSLDEDGDAVDPDDMGVWVWWQNYSVCAGAEDGSEEAALCELQGDSSWDYLLSVKWTGTELIATGDGA